MTHQQSALCLPSMSNLWKAYLEVRMIQKLSDSSPLFATGAHRLYALSHRDMRLSRTGLDISTSASKEEIEQCLLEAWKQYNERDVLRLEHKALNDHLVRTVLDIAGKAGKPGERFLCYSRSPFLRYEVQVQFHTGNSRNPRRVRTC